MSSFDLYGFKVKVDQALEKVKLILDNTRNPQTAHDVMHEYNDKFVLASSLTDSYIAASMNVLQTFGLSAEILAKLSNLNQSKAISLRFSSEERCVFDRKETRV